VIQDAKGAAQPLASEVGSLRLSTGQEPGPAQHGARAQTRISLVLGALAVLKNKNFHARDGHPTPVPALRSRSNSRA